MQSKKDSKNIRIIRGFLMSYILVLILPFAFGSFVYYKALDIIEKDAKDARIFMLKQSSSIIDNYLKNLDGTVISMSLNSNLRNLMYLDQPEYGSSDIYYVTLTQKEFKSFNTSSTFESVFYIFLKQSDLVLTRGDINFGIQQYFNSIYHSYSDLDYGKWYEKTLNNYHQREISTVKVAGNSANAERKNLYLTYTQSLPFGSGEKNMGAIVVLIKADGINKLLTDVDESNTGYTYILDKDGKLVTGVSNRSDNAIPDINFESGSSNGFVYRTIDGENMAVIHYKSAYNGWTYVTALPVKVFMDKALYIRKVILAIVSLTLLLGVSISIYLARRNIRPIQETLLTLRKVFKGELGSGKNEYEFLKNGVSKLVSNHEDLKRSVEDQEILMKSTFMSRLFHGEINDQKEIELLSGHLGMDLSGKKHAASIIALNRFTEVVNRELLIEQDINRVIIDDVVRKHIGQRCYTYIIDANQIALVLSFDSEQDGECESTTVTMLENIRNELQATFNINVNFGVGNLYDRIVDINLSFSEAKSALTLFNDVGTGSPVIWYKDMQKALPSYYYPVEMEKQLINMAKSGNKKDIDRLLDIIHNENFGKRNLINYMEYNLFFDMRGTIIKTVEEVGSNLDIKELISSKYSTMSVEEVFGTMKKAYYQLCNEASNKKRSHNDQLLEQLTDYIQSNYFSSEVSASNIATRFNISESYFSQFFKEQLGETFSEYLEKLRINRACELLGEKSLTVEDTARLVGYNSAYTFRRAFKRVMGVLPTEYRV